LKLFDCSNLEKVKISSKEEVAEIRALIAAHARKQFSFYHLVRKISQTSPLTPRLGGHGGR